jgi:hypothetical protein
VKDAFAVQKELLIKLKTTQVDFILVLYWLLFNFACHIVKKLVHCMWICDNNVALACWFFVVGNIIANDDGIESNNEWGECDWLIAWLEKLIYNFLGVIWIQISLIVFMDYGPVWIEWLV